MFRYQNQTDDDLLRLVQQSDSSALKELFGRYYTALCRFSYKYLFSEDLAEEAVSDIFTNIWLKRGEINITTSIKAYLYSAVRNQSLNYLKKIKRSEELTDSFENFNPVDFNDFRKEIEVNDELEKLLYNLPERRKLVFLMSRIDGLKYKEIAEILSISVNTVQNHIVEAVKSLMKNSPKK